MAESKVIISTKFDKASVENSVKEIDKMFKNLLNSDELGRLKKLFSAEQLQKYEQSLIKITQQNEKLGLAVEKSTKKSVDSIKQIHRSATDVLLKTMEFKGISNLLKDVTTLNKELRKIRSGEESRFSETEILASREKLVNQAKAISKSSKYSAVNRLSFAGVSSDLFDEKGLAFYDKKVESGIKSLTAYSQKKIAFENQILKITEHEKMVQKELEASEKRQTAEAQKQYEIDKKRAALRGSLVKAPVSGRLASMQSMSLGELESRQSSVAYGIATSRLNLFNLKNNNETPVATISAETRHLALLELENKLLINSIDLVRKRTVKEDESRRTIEQTASVDARLLNQKKEYLEALRSENRTVKENALVSIMARKQEIEDERLINSQKMSSSDTSLKEKLILQQKNKELAKELSILQSLSREHKEVRKEMERADKASRSWFVKFKDAIKGAATLEKAFNRMAFVLTATTSYAVFDTITSSLREGFNNAVKLEAELKKIFSLSEGENQRFVRTGALQSLRMGFNVEDVMKASQQAISSQYSTRETQYLLDVARKSAVAGGTSQEEALTAIVETLQAYKMSVEEAMHVSDLFFKTVDLGNTTLAELAPNIGKVSTTASLLGISFEEVVAALSAMTKDGLRTNVAITSLNQILMNMSAPTEEAKKIYDKYSISMDLSQIRTKGFAETIRQLNRLTEEEITTVASSNRGFRALAVAMKDNATWTAYYNEMSKAGGETQRAFNNQVETTDMKLRKLRGEFMAIGVSLGEASIKFGFLIDGMRFFVSGINNVVGGLIAFSGILAVIITQTKIVDRLLNLRVAGIVLLISAISSLIGMYGKRLEAEREFQEMEDQRNIKEKQALKEEENAQNKKAKLLRTYIALKENTLNKDVSDIEKKRLLISVTEELSEKYGIVNENLNVYKDTLAETEKKQQSLVNAIANLDIADATKNVYEVLNRSSSAGKRLLNTFEELTGNTVQPISQYGLTKAFRREDNILIRPQGTNLYSGGEFDPANLKKNLDAVKANHSVLKNNTKLLETLITARQTIYDEQERLYKRIQLSKKDYEAYSSYLKNSREALSVLTPVIDLGERLNKKNEIDKSIDMPSRANKQLTDEELNRIKSQKVKNAESSWNYSVALFKANLSGIQELKEARNSYLKEVKGLVSTESYNEREIESLNEIFGNVDNVLNKMIETSNLKMNTATSVEEYDQAVIERAKKLKDLRAKLVSLNSEYAGKRSAIDQQAYSVTLGNIDEKLSPKDVYLQRRTKLQIMEREKKEQLEKEMSIANLTVDGLHKLTDIELRGLKDSLKEYESIGEYIDQIVSVRQVNREKLEAELSDIDANDNRGFPAKALNVKQDSYQKKRKAIESSNVNNKKEYLDKLEKEANKERNDALIDATKGLVDSLKSIWDSYYEQRERRLEENKEKELEKIDQRAKEEYRSSKWVEAEKIKAEKEAEQERKRLGKLKKASMIAEATSSYSLGIIQIWARSLGANPLFGSILAGAMSSILTATFAANLAVISAQQFGEGGLIKDGKSHSQGGTLINAEKGEFVFTKKATNGNEKFLYGLQSVLQGDSVGKSLLNTTNLSSGQKSNQNVMVNVMNNNKELSDKLDRVVDAVSNIKYNFQFKGQVLSAPQLARIVDSGNKQRSVL